MIPLLLSITSSTLIYVVFKLLEKYHINTLQAITVNYVTGFLCGILLYKKEWSLPNILAASWFPYALFLGVMFILVFYLMALTTQRGGLSVVSVAAKMSVVVPIVFGLVYYKEHLGLTKAIGILAALVAVVLVSIKSKGKVPRKPSDLLLPFLVFLGSGLIDTLVKFMQDAYVSEAETPLFSASIFAMAAVLGLAMVAMQLKKNDFSFQIKNIFGGVALGIPNFFSVFFLIEALRSNIFESSGIFTVNNVAIVLSSTLIGIFLFKEKMVPKNWIGLVLAILAILLITLGKE